MDSPVAASPHSSRQARALRNDARIIDAAAHITATEGWAALVPSRVSADCGLVRSTVQARFHDRSALGAAVWQERCAPALADSLRALLRAGGQSGTPADTIGITASLSSLTQPSQNLLAAAELLVAAHYDPSVRTMVDGTLGQDIRTWCNSDGDVHGARTGYLLMVGLGLLLAARRTGAGGIEWAAIARALTDAIDTPQTPTALPVATAPHITGDLDLAPDDPALNSLLNATLREIGAHGFEGASVDAIARASDHTKGLVFSRFPSKLELFLEATSTQQSLAFVANDAFISQVAADHGRGIAEAVAIRELQQPRLAYARSIAMEQLRLSWHHRELKAAQEVDLDAAVAAQADLGADRFPDSAPVVHFAYAVGLGMAALPLLLPDSSHRPYDVMTVPLVDLGL